MIATRQTPLALVALLAAIGCGEKRGSETPIVYVTVPGGAADGSDVTVDSALCVRCHGDATRDALAGDAAGAAFAPPVDVDGATTSGKVGAHMKHLRAGTIRGEGLPCASCHVVPQNAGQHSPGVAFRGLESTSWAGARTAATYAGGACANTFCHGDFPGGNNATPSWTGTGPLGCNDCHGRAPGATATPPATTHAAGDTACGSCHPGYTTSAVNASVHVNGEIDGGCTGCHGTPGRTPAGQAGATYDSNLAAAPPVDHTGAASSLLVGAHLAHVDPNDASPYKPLLCSECHPAASAPTHQDGSPDVTLAGSPGANLAGFLPTETPSTGPTAATCTTYCHDAPSLTGGSVATWSWDGTGATCGSCHGAPPPPPHSASTACGGCHAGYTISTVDRATHIDGTIQALGCTGCHGTDGRANGDMAFPYDANQAAAPPLDTTGASTGILVGAHLAHVNPSNATGVYRPIACTECHPDNTTGTHPGGGLDVVFTDAIAANLAGFPASSTASSGGTAATCATYCHNGPNADGYGGTATPWSWNGSAATCGSCHGDPPATIGHTSAGVTPSTNCGLCHPGYGATTVDLATHINGQLDGGESIGGQDCGGCHGAIFDSMNGTVARATKHALGAVAGTNDSSTDSGLSWGVAQLTANAASARSCVNMCHGDHPHTLPGISTTHEYNAYVDSTTSTTRGATPAVGNRAKTDFLVGETNGGLCTSCHRTPISATRPTTITDASYGTKAHDFIQWPPTTPTWTWRFQLHSGAFDRNCTKCHASATEGTTPTVSVNSSGANSVHFNVNPALLAGTIHPNGIATGFVCYNCHGNGTPTNGTQGDRSGRDVQVQTAKAFAHPVDDDNVHDTAAEAGAAFNDGTFSGANRHVSCLDCHDTHRAGGTRHSPGSNAIATSSPLYGATGVGFTPPTTNWLTTGTFTFKALATAEYEVCFKCHSRFAFGAATPPTGPSGLVETDLAQEFSTANASYHPVLAALPATDPGANGSSRLATQQLLAPWTPGMVMTCSDCHGADAVAPAAQGPHGSAIRFMLTGTNRAWPYTTAGAASGQFYGLVADAETTTSAYTTAVPASGNANGLFCMNCHPNPRSTNNIHTDYVGENRSAHNNRSACVACHIRVPHGGKVSRLIVTPTAPLRYKVSAVAPILDDFAKASGYLNYSGSNFDDASSAGCSEHDSTTPTERW